MRGKGWCFYVCCSFSGITPAYAGKSSPKPGNAGAGWDHPRVCGEKLYPKLVSRNRIGSPPRMRGKASPRLKIEPLRGITPACAGKSRGTPFRRTSGRDHPRVCGEKSGFCQRSILHLGSPPRMRGKEQRMREARNSAGITPAYAGKSGEYMAGEDQYGDHPRVCGEKTRMTLILALQLGSPPRMRGKDTRAALRARVLRITPACAGKRPGNPGPQLG